MPTRDSSSPARVLNTTAGNTDSWTTASFSPPADSWLYLTLSGNPSGTGQTPTWNAPTNTGTALTWAQVGAPVNNASGGACAVWRAYNVNAQTGITVTGSVTWSTAGAGSATCAAWVDVWTGCASAQSGAAYSGTTGTAQTNNPAITVAATGSRVAGALLDWSATGAPTSADTIDSYHVAAQSSGARAYKAADSGASGSSVSVNLVTGGAGPTNSLVVYEIIATGQVPAPQVTLLGAGTFTTASGTKTVTATPAAGDLIVIVTAHTGNTVDTSPTDNNSSGTYTRINGALKNAGADKLNLYVRNALIASAASTVFTHAPGTTTGGGLVVLRVTGITSVGAAAVRQSAAQANQAASGTPTPTLAAAALTANILVGAVFNATNPATMTPRTSYTERADVGYATPTTGLEVMTRNSGETAAAIAWGSTSASAFGALAVELIASGTISLTAANVSVPAAMSAAAITQTHNLTATGISVPVAISAPTLAGAIDLTAESILVPIAVSTAALTQAHALTVANISVPASISAPAVTQTHALVASGVNVPVAVSTITVTQAHALTATNIAVPVALGAVSVTQAHNLTAGSISVPIVISAPTLSGAIDLAAAGISVPVALSNPALLQAHALTASNIAVPIAISEPTIGAAINLVAASISVPITIESPSLYVVPDEVFGGRRPKKPEPLRQQVVTLRPANMRCAVSVSAAALRQQHRLVASGIGAPVTIESPLIEQWQAARLTRGTGLFGLPLARDAVSARGAP